MSKGRIAAYFVKALLIAYVITGLLVIFTAWITYKMSFSDREINLFVTFIYIIANGIGGLYIGKCMGYRRFMWGMLAGVMYVLILFIVSIICTGGFAGISLDGVCAAALCIAGGTFGGMIS